MYALLSNSMFLFVIKVGKDANLLSMGITIVLASSIVGYNVYTKNKDKLSIEETWDYELIVDERSTSKLIADNLKSKGLDVITVESYTHDVDSVLMIKVKSHSKNDSKLIMRVIPKGTLVNRYPVETFRKR